MSTEDKPIFSTNTGPKLNTLGFIILLLCLILVSIGTIMNTSASLDFGKFIFGDSLFFLKRQLLYIFITFSICYFIYRIPMSTWFRLAPLLLIVCTILLVIVLIPSIGLKVNGSRRWLFLGFMTIQVVEFGKLFFCLYLSGYLVRHRKELDKVWGGLIKPLIILSFLSILILMQPDFGSVIILTILLSGMLYFANVKIIYLLTFFSFSLVTLLILLYSAPYRLERVITMFAPWENQFDSGYQLTQSLIAIGKGHIFGSGLGNSIQKLFFLPEAHTDYIFAIIAEELGFIGAFIILILQVALIFAIVNLGNYIQNNPTSYYQKTSLKNKQQITMFCSLICFGGAVLFTGHLFINIAMTLGLLPTKGLTLPFISYGGSSLLATSLLITILMRIASEFKNEHENEQSPKQ